MCKESYAYPMNFLCDKYLNIGYDVDALFIHSSESVYEDESLTLFKARNKNCTIITIRSVVEEFIKNKSKCESLIDLEYLGYIENKYCKDLPISLLQISSQLFTTQYHYRFFFEQWTESEKLYYIQLLFKFIINLIESGRYEKICDFDIAEIGRSILLQVSKVHKVPYASLEFSRFNDIVLLTFNLGRVTDNYIVEKYNQLLSLPVEKKYLKKANEFLEKNVIQSPDYKNNNTSKNKSKPLLHDFKSMLKHVKFVITRLPSWFKFKRSKLLANPFKSAFFFMLWFIRERYLLSKYNTLFSTPIDSDKYIYFPLHLIPESTTLNKSPFYPNELSVIQQLSKVLPVGWKLYIKEHGAMIGERPISFYKEIIKCTNVKLVRLDYYNDPKPWIYKSKGVVTLSGTTSFEALMLDKPTAIYGNVPFDVVPQVKKITSNSSLLDFICSCENFDVSTKEHDVQRAVYIKTIESLGIRFPILKVLNDCKKAIQSGGELDSESAALIDNLFELYQTELVTDTYARA